MQHISDDMDDLLRNAAENYPLKISGADWEGIAGRLLTEEEDKEPVAVVAPPQRGGSLRLLRYAALLLLIPLAWLIVKYAGTHARVNTLTLDEQAAATKINSGNKNNQVVTTAPGSVGIGNNSANVQAGSIDQSGAAAKDGKLLVRIKTHGSGILGTHGDADKDIFGKARSKKDEDSIKVNNVFAVKPNKTDSRIKTPKDSADDEGNYGKLPPGVKPVPKRVDSVPPAPGAAVDPIINLRRSRPKRFYIGAYVAPEYSTIKYQPGSKIGFTYGGLFGYKLSKSLSVEAGIAAGKKYYTSDGKYFNSDAWWFHYYGKVLSLSGSVTLTEFPISLKYNFKASREGNFFIGGSLVSYITHQESYTYVLDKDNRVYSISKTPIMATRNFFSNVTISGGYESQLGNLCNFRIEPYYTLPLRGVGIGGLPITSIGLNIGITKKIK